MKSAKRTEGSGSAAEFVLGAVSCDDNRTKTASDGWRVRYCIDQTVRWSRSKLLPARRRWQKQSGAVVGFKWITADAVEAGVVGILIDNMTQAQTE